MFNYEDKEEIILLIAELLKRSVGIYHIDQHSIDNAVGRMLAELRIDMDIDTAPTESPSHG